MLYSRFCIKKMGIPLTLIILQQLDTIPISLCRFVKHIGQYGNVKIQKETTNEEDASAYY
jgi:hypothetical protein